MTYSYKYKVGQEPKQCKCGCGEFTKYPRAEFVWGHHFRLKEFQRKEMESIKNICKQCKITFISKSYHRKKSDYCSRICSQKSHKNGEYRNCLECSNEFYIPNYKIKEGKGIYCSNKCRISNWSRNSLEKQAAGNYKINAWRTYERKCYDCGYNTRPEILVIHHIDGNRKNGKIDNLIPVCQNCHCIRHIEMSGNHRLPSARVKRMLSD